MESGQARLAPGLGNDLRGRSTSAVSGHRTVPDARSIGRMDCPKCGTVCPDTAKRCDCGTRLERRSIDVERERVQENLAKRNRGGCLTVWLWFVVIGGAFGTAAGLANGSATQWIWSLVVVICGYAALQWKSWGALGLGVMYATSPFALAAITPGLNFTIVLLVSLPVLGAYAYLVRRVWPQFAPGWQPPGVGEPDHPKPVGRSERRRKRSPDSVPPPKAGHYCRGCRTQNDPDAEFCESCGAALRPQPCPKCGTTNKAAAGFCKKCGHSLGGKGKAETRDAQL